MLSLSNDLLCLNELEIFQNLIIPESKNSFNRVIKSMTNPFWSIEYECPWDVVDNLHYVFITGYFLTIKFNEN